MIFQDGHSSLVLLSDSVKCSVHHVAETSKKVIAYPVQIELTLAEGFQSSQHLQTPERKADRLQRGREFYENESRREECIKHAEDLLNAAIAP